MVYNLMLATLLYVTGKLASRLLIPWIINLYLQSVLILMVYGLVNIFTMTYLYACPTLEQASIWSGCILITSLNTSMAFWNIWNRRHTCRINVKWGKTWTARVVIICFISLCYLFNKWKGKSYKVNIYKSQQ